MYTVQSIPGVQAPGLPFTGSCRLGSGNSRGVVGPLCTPALVGSARYAVCPGALAATQTESAEICNVYARVGEHQLHRYRNNMEYFDHQPHRLSTRTIESLRRSHYG